jgi:predicted ArsR family transcriptional regulator
LLVEAAGTSDSDLPAAIGRTARDRGCKLGAAAAAGEGDSEQTLHALLRSRGYEPVEREPGELRLRNCPFDAIAGRHPDLVCGLNLALIEGILDGLGTDGASAVLAPEDGACCVAIRTG